VPDVTFANPDDDAIAKLLRAARIIAIVGLSPDRNRPSYGVAHGLERFGYRIVPVNPNIEVWNGRRAASDLASACGMLAQGERIDVVDVFRRPEYVDSIVDDCIELGLPMLWLQLGVVNVAAAARARAAGITTVMDSCLYVERAKLGGSVPSS
jgi:predicted CoA-binding protein